MHQQMNNLLAYFVYLYMKYLDAPQTITIPIFPLAIFLLPQGITRLRIFEKRYLNMVKLASKAHGFAILLNNESDNDNNCRIASWVDIIDFDTSEDGILQIDVKCKSLIALHSSYIDEEQLMWAKFDTYQHWQEHQHDATTQKFSELLKRFFQHSKELTKLYNNEYINQPNWVIARWLELLPIKNEYKAHFFLSDTYEKATEFLTELLLPNKH